MHDHHQTFKMPVRLDAQNKQSAYNNVAQINSSIQSNQQVFEMPSANEYID